MSLIDSIRNTSNKIITDPLCGHNIPVALTSATENPVNIETNAILTDHHTMIDPQTGIEVVANQVHILLSTTDLIEKGYPVFRDEKYTNRPIVKNDTVVYSGANGETKTVKIKIDKPNLAQGNISCFCVESE